MSADDDEFLTVTNSTDQLSFDDLPTEPVFLGVSVGVDAGTDRSHCCLARRLASGTQRVGPGLHEDGFGLRVFDRVDSPVGSAAWIDYLMAEPNPANPAEHRNVYRWIVENGEVLGGIALRYGNSAYVGWAGHIGFGIRPSARRRGLATWSLNQMLGEAKSAGLQRLLTVCAVDNDASTKTIERCGGVFEKAEETPYGAVTRYWIDLQRTANE